MIFAKYKLFKNMLFEELSWCKLEKNIIESRFQEIFQKFLKCTQIIFWFENVKYLKGSMTHLVSKIWLKTIESSI